MMADCASMGPVQVLIRLPVYPGPAAGQLHAGTWPHAPKPHAPPASMLHLEVPAHFDVPLQLFLPHGFYGILEPKDVPPYHLGP